MRNFAKLFALIVLPAALAACDDPYDPNAPAIDPDAPLIHITTPDFGTVAGDVHNVMVTGTVSDDSGVATVKVNDVVALVASDGTFSAQVPVRPGTNLLHAIATDKQGNVGKETRAVVAGPMSGLDQKVIDGITATISAQTLDSVARSLASFVQDGDLTAAVQPMNPVLNLGAPNGPDCLYAQAAITSMDVQTADVVMAPKTGGVFLSGELNNVKIGMHLQYAAFCADGSRDITIAASKVSVQGLLYIGVASGKFDISLRNQNVSITGFDVDLGGIPGSVVDLLHLDTAMGPILGFAVEKFVIPMFNKTLQGLGETKTVDILGKQVDISMTPEDVNFTNEGGTIRINSQMRAKGDTGKFVFTPNTTPIMDMSHGFQLAVADDAADQLMTSLWSAKGMDGTFDLKTGPYGDIGKLYDSVEIEAKVPPYVEATNDKLTMTVGDLIASFKLGGSVVTKVAINAEVGLKVSNNADGSLHFDVGEPTTYVDILDQGVDGANALSNADFEQIISFALSRVVSVGSGSLGAIPLPSFGPVQVSTLGVDEQYGYLIVQGEIQ